MMYLLDNHRKNVELNVLKKISDVKSLNELINISSDKLDGIDYFFNKMDYALRTSPLLDSKRTRENITKLFTNPPLSMDINSNELKDILSKYLRNPKASYMSNFKHELQIVKTYKELLLEKLKTNSTISSYDIVGQVTSNFNSLFYGINFIDKTTMNKFLNGVEQENNLKSNESIDIKDELEEYCSKYDFPYFPDRIDLTIHNIQTSLSEKKQKLEEVKSLEFIQSISKLKHNAFKKIKVQLLDSINSGFSSESLFLFNSEFLRNKTGKIIQDKSLSSLEIYESLDVIHYDVRNEIKTLKFDNLITDKKKERLFNLIKLDDELNLVIPQIKTIINNEDNFNFESKRVNNVNFEELNSKYLIELKEFQSINKSFLLSNSLDKTKYVLTQLQIDNNSLNNETRKDFFKLTKDMINFIPDLDKYNINDIKQFLYLALSNNKTIYNLLKESDMFVNLANNQFIKDLVNKEIIISSNDFDLNRLKYVLDIIIFNKDIETLFTKDININIKNMFFTKLGLEINSNNGSLKLKEVLQLLESKQSQLNIKNTNILLGIILNSYVDSKFDSNLFDKFINCLNTPVNRLDKEQKELIDTIDDKWLKWGIVFNREIKDPNVFNSSINPMNFEFNKMQTIKKMIESKDNTKNFNKYDYNLYYFLTKNSNNLENDVNLVSDAFSDFKNRFIEISKHTKTKRSYHSLFHIKGNSLTLKTPEDKFNNLIYMFNRSLENVLDSKVPFIQHKINNMKDVSNDFFESINEIIALSRLENFLKDDRIKTSDINPKEAYQILKSNKNLGSIIKNVSNEVYTNILENIDALPKLSKESFKKYIEYYETMSEKYDFKNFDKNSCHIPVIEKNMGNGYSYKVKTIKDFDVLLTGEKTNCCMTFGNAGWSIYKHMYEHPKSNTIFEVYKNGKAVANSWTWFEKNQICFDNVEVLGAELRDSIVDCYKDASIRFITEGKNIDLVTFGLGHTDINYESLGTLSKNYEDFTWKNVYTDSFRQLAIATKNINIIDKEIMLEKLNDSNVDKNLILKLTNDFYEGEINLDKIKVNNKSIYNNQNNMFNFDLDNDEFDF